MARYINADAFADRLLNAWNIAEEQKRADIVAIMANIVTPILVGTPTADVVEVVRCKDCKYQYDCARQMVHTSRDYVLEQNISTYNKVDFCSYGERSETNAE